MAGTGKEANTTGKTKRRNPSPHPRQWGRNTNRFNRHRQRLNHQLRGSSYQQRRSANTAQTCANLEISSRPSPSSCLPPGFRQAKQGILMEDNPPFSFPDHGLCNTGRGGGFGTKPPLSLESPTTLGRRSGGARPPQPQSRLCS
jgi:hypothetical protein